MTELCDLSAADLRRMIGAKEISPVELLDSCIARTEAVDGAVTTADSNHIAPLTRSVPVAGKRGFVGSTAAWQPVSAEIYPAIESSRPRSREGTRSA